MSVDRLRIVLKTIELLAALAVGMLIGRNFLAPSHQVRHLPEMNAIAKSDSDCYKKFIEGLAKESQWGEGRDSVSIEVTKIERRVEKIDEALQRAGVSRSGLPGC
ncbi:MULTISPECIES: hypothetical protein [Methylobacterium]|jgi:hypothetical protein|uniref:hypothetical protein n=1 Tax=Methylobacterium TaxID=407 RepID=UPI000AB5A0B8|nr:MULTISPECIES: hypothetical protein [Methylobacterium]MBK3397481.1 hypothetical protein [Methylobacterium ajmalii]MBK3409081.1 hypothetical protein [Methylobacterium ajmalii]MBK3424909.1 hypothetical protein [Methylobacterium ajmalii]MBZ6414100.1 hypothetical protein [Methylobacterium sp.]